MKKNLLLLGLAVAAMTSCTNDEVVDMKQPTQHAIGFEGFVNKGTRAEVVTETNEVTAGNLKRFYVYGYYSTTSVFNNVDVILDNGTWKMEESDEENWTTESYHFAAYADGPGTADYAASDLKTSFANETLNFTDYTVNENQGSQTDLIAAITSRDNTSIFNTAKVDLTFNHLLSKVDFKFSNTNDEINSSNLSMVVNNVVLTVQNKANCAYSSSGAEWTWGDNPIQTVYSLAQPSYSGGTGAQITLNKDNDVTETISNEFIIPSGKESIISLEYFVIPKQTTATISFDVEYYDANYNLVESDSKNISLFPNNTVALIWTPSYIYKYDVNLPATPKKIEFNVSSIGSWQSTEVPLDGSAN